MIHLVSTERLRPAPWNPRGAIDDASLTELVASIAAQGVLTPLLVRSVEGDLDDYFEVIAGHRRLRAAQLSDVASVPVRVVDASDQEAREIAIVENLQREDIPPLEEARAFRSLVDDGVAPATIAKRVCKPERYVWERLRLLHLVPEAVALLASGTITVQHAIVLARLDHDEQSRVIQFGLFTGEKALQLEDENEEDEDKPWAGMKPVSVRELQRYIAEHVRFRPDQAAEAAPLDFGPVAEQVAEAAAKPGRGRKVVHITRDHYVQPSARTTERVFTARTWKRADGLEDSETCDRSVLGVVVVGPGQGDAFHVCVHKDCETHWAEEQREAERRAGQGAQRDRASEEAEERKAKQRQAREEAERKAWETEKATILQAFGAHLAAVQLDIVEVVKTHLNDYGIKRVANVFGVPLRADTALAVLVLNGVTEWNRDTFAAHARRWKFKVPKPGEKPAATAPAAKKAAPKAKAKSAAKAKQAKAAVLAKKRRAA